MIRVRETLRQGGFSGGMLSPESRWNEIVEEAAKELVHRVNGITPESVHAIRLTDYAEPERAEAVQAIIKRLKEENLVPRHFYVSVDPRTEPENHWLFHLWHRDAFLRKNWYTVGNPGSHCVDVDYNRKTGQVEKIVAWQ